MRMTSRIECIFFSEFHPTLGPKITYQVSENPNKLNHMYQEALAAVIWLHVIILEQDVQNGTSSSLTKVSRFTFIGCI